MDNIINGKKIAQEIKTQIKKEIDDIKNKYNKVPSLAVIKVGHNPASEIYVSMKKKTCEDLGINSIQVNLEDTTTPDNIINLIHEMNEDKNINGILVQLPLPKHINENDIINKILPEKDVDGFHPVNMGKLLIGESDCFIPCTPYGCQELILRAESDIKGKHLVVVGRSNIVGKPLAAIMMQKNKNANCIVTVCHSACKDISYYTKQADILVAAVGKPNMITSDMVKEGVIIIDVGINRIEADGNKKIVGDVDFENVKQKAKAITPVPGGVGPMTIAMLMKNTLKAFKIQNNIQ